MKKLVAMVLTLTLIFAISISVTGVDAPLEPTSIVITCPDECDDCQ